ncbi:hypothetical protein WG906_18130 [Pedobacter sp. P351]|uniref:hypothetical protein n=1 Tax=Pedobacter superstes TaxID=3133441 RepID=UPI0030B311C3
MAVVQLHCQPSKSIKAWKRLGFKEYPDVKDFESFNSANDKYLYKILVPHDNPRKLTKATGSIELWSVEPYMSNRHAPAWIWKPKFKKDTGKLALPIIFPAKPDWNICWKINNKVIKEEKVKRFGKKDIDFGNFIIIEELPLTQP